MIFLYAPRGSRLIEYLGAASACELSTWKVNFLEFYCGGKPGEWERERERGRAGEAEKELRLMIISVAARAGLGERERRWRARWPRLEARRLSFQLIFADRERIHLGKVSLKRLEWDLPSIALLFLALSFCSRGARSKNLICLLERDCIGPIGQMAFQHAFFARSPLLALSLFLRLLCYFHLFSSLAFPSLSLSARALFISLPI